ncbi:MAG: hypothetical protein SFU98_20570 [Leptospiraceae bacterium]|nr:hypothetical protein [Leptospiraceae bacterium]
MKFIIALLIILTCSKPKPKYKTEKNSDYRELSSPIFLKHYNLMILPKESNYLQNENLKVEIHLGDQKYFSSSDKIQNNINYLWKDLNNSDGKINYLFSKDIAIITRVDEIDLDEPERYTRFPIPFSVIIGITHDTNKDNKITEEDDVSLFLFNYSTKKLTKISPEGIGIKSSSCEIVFLKKSSSSDKFNPESYIIYFEDKNNVNKRYFYHIKNNYLETVINL